MSTQRREEKSAPARRRERERGREGERERGREGERERERALWLLFLYVSFLPRACPM